MLLSLASWSLLSSAGAWLLKLRGEARGNELDRPGRHSTAHSPLSSLLGKWQQRHPDHFTQYTHSTSELLPCPFMSTGTNNFYKPSQQLTRERGSKFASLFSDESICGMLSQIQSGVFAWSSHGDMFMFTVHGDAYLLCVLVIMCLCAVLTARKSMQYIPKEEWPE